MKFYAVNSIIRYQPFCGNPRTVKVIYRDDDIKNGRPGFDAIEVEQQNSTWVEKPNANVWGYDSQIINVLA